MTPEDNNEQYVPIEAILTETPLYQLQGIANTNRANLKWIGNTQGNSEIFYQEDVGELGSKQCKTLTYIYTNENITNPINILRITITNMVTNTVESDLILQYTANTISTTEEMTGTLKLVLNGENKNIENFPERENIMYTMLSYLLDRNEKD